MTDDEKTDALLRQMAAEEYNRPPEIVPREQMWEAVQRGLGTGDRGLGVVPLSSVRRVPRWVYFAIAAAILLAVGIQLGRLIGPTAPPIAKGTPAPGTADSLGPSRVAPESISVGNPSTTVARTDNDGKGPPKPKGGPERNANPNLGDDVAATSYTVAASHHLTEAEAMLTAFKGDLSQGRMDAEISSWGKDLLSNTRLLLDSPAANDPVRRKLLQDLELVLVQIVQLSPRSSARDRDLIKGALTDDQVLTRLRTAIPVKGT
jgi:hypothetical protein